MVVAVTVVSLYTEYPLDSSDLMIIDQNHNLQMYKNLTIFGSLGAAFFFGS